MIRDREEYMKPLDPDEERKAMSAFVEATYAVGSSPRMEGARERWNHWRRKLERRGFEVKMVCKMDGRRRTRCLCAAVMPRIANEEEFAHQLCQDIAYFEAIRRWMGKVEVPKGQKRTMRGLAKELKSRIDCIKYELGKSVYGRRVKKDVLKKYIEAVDWGFGKAAEGEGGKEA